MMLIKASELPIFMRRRKAAADLAKLLAAIPAHKEVAPLLSEEHFSVDGTLVKAWAWGRGCRLSRTAPGSDRNRRRSSHYLARLAHIAQLPRQLPQPNLRKDDLLFRRRGVYKPPAGLGTVGWRSADIAEEQRGKGKHVDCVDQHETIDSTGEPEDTEHAGHRQTDVLPRIRQSRLACMAGSSATSAGIQRKRGERKISSPDRQLGGSCYFCLGPERQAALGSKPACLPAFLAPGHGSGSESRFCHVSRPWRSPPRSRLPRSLRHSVDGCLFGWASVRSVFSRCRFRPRHVLARHLARGETCPVCHRARADQCWLAARVCDDAADNTPQALGALDVLCGGGFGPIGSGAIGIRLLHSAVDENQSCTRQCGLAPEHATGTGVDRGPVPLG